MRREFLSTFLRTMRCLTGKFFVIQRSLFEDSGRQIVLISPAFVVVGSVHAVAIWFVICFSRFRKSRLQKISDFLREPLRAARFRSDTGDEGFAGIAPVKSFPHQTTISTTWRATSAMVQRLVST
jgi:hypothetical protein